MQNVEVRLASAASEKAGKSGPFVCPHVFLRVTSPETVSQTDAFIPEAVL
jgi:hypothetical protein